jgi:ABC-type branched-subunit amino acid transport system ATPase component
MNAPAALEIRAVTVAYGGLRAVDDVSLSVVPGSVVCLLGANGSGKTTLLNAVSGQVRPTSGAVLLDGEDLCDWHPEDRATLGMVRSFQDARLFPDLTVEETLLVGEDARRPPRTLATAVRWPSASRLERHKRAAVDDLLDAFGLTGFRHVLVRELSTGTRRVVDLALVVSAGPRLLLLDEPTAGIAQREAEAFGPLLRRLHEVTGATVVLVEHDIPLAVGLADQLAVLEAGRLVSSGPKADVLADPAAVAAYLGVGAEASQRTGARVPAGAARGGDA